MIVVAIVAITAAIALPSYQNQIEKTRRSTAKADLVELASFMQRFYTENNRFDQDRAAVAVAIPFNESPQDGTAKFYDLTLSAVGSSSYTLSAAPKGAQSGDSCGTLTVAHTGAKTHSSGSNCW
jgi:type IV pilus assembly protein PilE